MDIAHGTGFCCLPLKSNDLCSTSNFNHWLINLVLYFVRPDLWKSPRHFLSLFELMALSPLQLLPGFSVILWWQDWSGTYSKAWFLLICWCFKCIPKNPLCVCVCLVAQSCPTLCESMDCSSPGSTWDSPGKSTGVSSHSPPRDRTGSLCNVKHISWLWWERKFSFLSITQLQVCLFFS